MNRNFYITLLLVLTLCITMIGCSKPPLTYDEQISLGNKYLSEGNYKEAILAFEVAIKIDSKSIPAYLGIADAYIALGDTESAVAALSIGYEKTQNNMIKDKMELISNNNVDANLEPTTMLETNNVQYTRKSQEIELGQNMRYRAWYGYLKKENYLVGQVIPISLFLKHDKTSESDLTYSTIVEFEGLIYVPIASKIDTRKKGGNPDIHSFSNIISKSNSIEINGDIGTTTHALILLKTTEAKNASFTIKTFKNSELINEEKVSIQVLGKDGSYKIMSSASFHLIYELTSESISGDELSKVLDGFKGLGWKPAMLIDSPDIFQLDAKGDVLFDLSVEMYRGEDYVQITNSITIKNPLAIGTITINDGETFYKTDETGIFDGYSSFANFDFTNSIINYDALGQPDNMEPTDPE